MDHQDTSVLPLVNNLNQKWVEAGLPPPFAKLYSQHTRLRQGQSGLHFWSPTDARARLADAIRLLEAASIQKDANIPGWRATMCRVGELLEWLSHPQLNPNALPLPLLAAAAYQLAGYPARAAGILRQPHLDTVESSILRAFLRADFPELLHLITEHWTEAGRTVPPFGSDEKTETSAALLQQWLVEETASSLGILCVGMRWGIDPRSEKAIIKLRAIADTLANGENAYSWLLAKLCAEVASVYSENALRKQLEAVTPQLGVAGQKAIDRYLRQNYVAARSLAWPSQIQGIAKLQQNESFALCTPTGSGKTTIAELGIIQNLFLETPEPPLEASTATFAPLALYLVPSRALAAEVESKLSRVFRNLDEDEPLTVTGLYGGTDWGPTDVWLTAENRTVLICTYEKAEALIRFLGPRFLRRVALVVIDEAHQIQFDGRVEELTQGESRALRLETLGARLLAYMDENKSRIIALSAVAAGAEDAIAHWITGQLDAAPTRTTYRSTRQLIGRLECLPDRRFTMHYDLLDGASLRFEEQQQAQNPFIPNPFPPCPPSPDWDREDSPEKKLRPYLFWAAMHLATADETQIQRAVLISITQRIETYATDFVTLLTKTWSNHQLPVFFQPPEPASENFKIWQRCLRSCADYFGPTSNEYKLLQRGIVVHHGKMPGLLARLLIEVVDKQIVHLVIATSTLSEGVNLPFETVLIPSLQRGSGTGLSRLSLREFTNLVGRAGRPGHGTEGRSLVLLPSEPTKTQRDSNALKIRQRYQEYRNLIEEYQNQASTNSAIGGAQSPLAELLRQIQTQWRTISGMRNDRGFELWLEQTAPLTMSETSNNATQTATTTLDALDGVLLSAIVEMENLDNQAIDPSELEDRLRLLWQRTYARFAEKDEAELSSLFVRRGFALQTHIYPNSRQRRELYRTNLTPRSGRRLLDLYPILKSHLVTGKEYANWSTFDRLQYIESIIDQLGKIPSFSLRPQLDWHAVLHWWLNPGLAPKVPNGNDIARWHSYVTQNFGYRFNWGLGSVISLAVDEAYNGEPREPSLETWPQTGLPWIVLWLKELITWGTLDPVAAYLLSRGLRITRSDAEGTALEYYKQFTHETSPDEILNALTIKDWVQTLPREERPEGDIKLPSEIPAILLRDFSHNPQQQWRVLPIENGNEIRWLDPAGFPLASSTKPRLWSKRYIDTYDFILDVGKNLVLTQPYQ